MQKVLLASTALVMTTGWAMADVINVGDGVGATITLEGAAAMGIIGKDYDGEDSDSEVSFATDVDVRFLMAGQTDGGLEFGASIDLDETDAACTEDEIEEVGFDADGDGDIDADDSISFLAGCGQSTAFDPERQGGEEIYIRGAFGALYMGDTDGALDWAMSEASIGGSIGDIQEHLGWNGNSGLDGIHDGQVARYEYAFGDFGVAFSAEIDDANDADPALGLGAKYNTAFGGANVAFGAGVQTVSSVGDIAGDIFDDEEDFDAVVWGLSADVSLNNGFRTILNYSQADLSEGDFDPQHYGIAVGYEAGPLLVAVNYGHFDDWTVGATEPLSREGLGLLANYDLGGGASLQGAVAHNVPDGDADSFMTYSFGVAMSF